MTTVEAAKGENLLFDFDCCSVLVPVMMKFLLYEDAAVLVDWGEDIYWLRIVLHDLGVTNEEDVAGIREIIRAGKKRVWGTGASNLGEVTGRVVGKWQGREALLGWWKEHLIVAAVKATIVAAGGKANFWENMKFFRQLAVEPAILDELLLQLKVEMSGADRKRLDHLLREVDWR